VTEPWPVFDVAIILSSILLGLIAVLSEEMLQAIVAFFLMSMTVAVMFYLMGAIYAAVFQVLVYGGFLFVLLLVTFQTVRRH
jgi:uncharacterized MnhB-related membrane protein